MKNILTLLLLPVLLISCQPAEQPKPEMAEAETKVEITYNQKPIIADIEKAHNKAAFLAKEAIEFNLELYFGERKRIDGKITMKTDGSLAKLELDTNKIIYCDGMDVYHNSTYPNAKGIRFTAFTWSYFFLFPFKLSDPGTIWNTFENDSLNGKQYFTEKLTFEGGTGDAPDDWYILYADKETKLAQVGAYIVTAGKGDVSEAEEDPHAIKYENYTNVNGVPIATKWTFWGWKNGKFTKQLGRGSLTNIKFVNLDDGFFKAPDNYLKK